MKWPLEVVHVIVDGSTPIHIWTGLIRFSGLKNRFLIIGYNVRGDMVRCPRGFIKWRVGIIKICHIHNMKLSKTR